MPIPPITQIDPIRQGITPEAPQLPIREWRFNTAPLAEALSAAAKVHQARLEQVAKITSAKEHANALSDIWAIRQDLDNKIAQGEIQDFDAYRKQARERFGEVTKNLPAAVQSDPYFINQSTSIESSGLNMASEYFAKKAIEDATAKTVAGIEAMVQGATPETSREVLETADQSVEALTSLSAAKKLELRRAIRNDMYGRLVREDLLDREIPASEVEKRIDSGWYELTGDAREQAMNTIRQARAREESELEYQRSGKIYQQFIAGTIGEKGLMEAAQRKDITWSTAVGMIHQLRAEAEARKQSQNLIKIVTDALNRGGGIDPTLNQSQDAIDQYYVEQIMPRQSKELQDISSLARKEGYEPSQTPLVQQAVQRHIQENAMLVKTLGRVPGPILSRLRAVVNSPQSTAQDWGAAIAEWEVYEAANGTAAADVKDPYINYLRVGTTLKETQGLEIAAQSAMRYSRMTEDDKKNLKDLSTSPQVTKSLVTELSTKYPEMGVEFWQGVTKSARSLIQYGLVSDIRDPSVIVQTAAKQLLNSSEGYGEFAGAMMKYPPNRILRLDPMGEEFLLDDLKNFIKQSESFQNTPYKKEELKTILEIPPEDDIWSGTMSSFTSPVMIRQTVEEQGTQPLFKDQAIPGKFAYFFLMGRPDSKTTRSWDIRMVEPSGLVSTVGTYQWTAETQKQYEKWRAKRDKEMAEDQSQYEKHLTPLRNLIFKMAEKIP